MKTILQKAIHIFRKYYFIIFAVAALILPDAMLKSLVSPGSFSEAFVPRVAWLFTLGWILLILVVCVVILPKRWGKILFGVVSVIFTAFAFSECVYFKIFDQFFWIKSIMMAGEGADYLDYVFDVIDVGMISCAVLSIGLMVLALVFWKEIKIAVKFRLVVASVPVLLLAGLHVYMQPVIHHVDMSQWDTWRKPVAVYKNFNDANRSFEVTGVYQFLFLDLYNTAFPKSKYTSEEYQKAETFFETKGGLQENVYTGLFKDKNVIAVMLESMDSWTIDEKTTPTLSYMMANGINFTDYNAPMFGVGFTLNSEFAFNTGYFTPVSAVSAAHFSANQFPYALANLFSDAGYTTNSFHFNEAGFYNRGILHKAFGYEKYNSLSEFGLTGVAAELDSNILKNDALYKKMTEKQPFFNFFITYSAHLPYTDESAKLKLAKEYRPDLLNAGVHPEHNNMQILAADTDDFFKQLLTRLEEDGLLDDTVIVAYTDHFAYGISDEALLSELKGEERIYRVPAFIYAKGIEGVEVSKPMMTVDWAPTLVNLFDLDRNGGYMGSDVLDPEFDGFAYFENWSWLDGEGFYNPAEENGEETDRIRKHNQRVKDSMEVNDIVVLGDYYANHE